jgi:hypothetical protein
MSGTSELFLNQTIEFWQPLANRQLTHEDARQISENLSGFFDLLKVWASSSDINEPYRETGRINGGIES